MFVIFVQSFCSKCTYFLFVFAQICPTCNFDQKNKIKIKNNTGTFPSSLQTSVIILMGCFSLQVLSSRVECISNLLFTDFLYLHPPQNSQTFKMWTMCNSLLCSSNIFLYKHLIYSHVTCPYLVFKQHICNSKAVFCKMLRSLYIFHFLFYILYFIFLYYFLFQPYWAIENSHPFVCEHLSFKKRKNLL